MMYKTEGLSEPRKRINAAKWLLSYVFSFDVNAVAFCEQAPESRCHHKSEI